MPVRHTLSKSTFMMGMQCPKRFWLHKHRPELSYNTLTISNGGDAGTAFYNLKHMEDEKEKQAIRKGLPEYCGPDTMGMVRIWERLKQA